MPLHYVKSLKPKDLLDEKTARHARDVVRGLVLEKGVAGTAALIGRSVSTVRSYRDANSNPTIPTWNRIQKVALELGLGVEPVRENSDQWNHHLVDESSKEATSPASLP